MKRNIVFAAVVIAMLATAAACSPSAAAAPSSSSTPQRNATPGNLVLAPSLNYEINGSLYAYIDFKGSLSLSATGIPGFSSMYIIIHEFYVGIKITLLCTNIAVDVNTGVGTAQLNVTATLVGRMNIDVNGTTQTDNVNMRYSVLVPAKWLVPWGATKNFTAFVPVMGPEQASSGEANPAPVTVKLTQANITEDSLKYATIHHITWDFGDYIRTQLQKGLNKLWGDVIVGMPSYLTSGFTGGFDVVTSIARVDLWKADVPLGNGTVVQDVLLMAGGVIDLLVKWDLAGHQTFSTSYGGQQISVTFDVDLHAKMAVQLTLEVTSDWFRNNGGKMVGGSGSFYGMINTLSVRVPENATFTWKKVGVIVYYGSPAHDLDVAGGKTRGQTNWGGQTLFFVDYGWDGTPDFITDGNLQYAFTLPHATVTGTPPTLTVTLDKTNGQWIGFNVTLPDGYSVKAVKRETGAAINATQYWISEDGKLYILDDPTFTYTIELIPPAGPLGLSNLLFIGIAAVAIIGIAAAVVVRRRKTASIAVSVK